jgi:hypothetical protein
MSAGHWRIKPSEIERTLKSIKSVGLHVQSIELAADGTIKITVTEAETNKSDAPETPEQLKRLL